MKCEMWKTVLVNSDSVPYGVQSPISDAKCGFVMEKEMLYHMWVFMSVYTVQYTHEKYSEH